MKINPVRFNSYKFSCAAARNSVETQYQCTALPAKNAPLSALQANTLISFGKFKKVGSAILKDRQTGEDVPATIRRESFLNEFVFYELYVGRKRVGYMDMSPCSCLPSNYTDDPFQTYSEIGHIRSLDGDKYERIGSTLVNLAIEESRKNNNKGAIWLIAEKGYQRAASPYRSNESPVPFYYKLGFRAFDGSDKNIKDLIKNEQFDKLPDKILLILNPEKANSENKYLEKNFKIKAAL